MTSMTTPRRWRADDRGTAFNHALPWLRSAGAVVDAAQDLLNGIGTKAELARTLTNYNAATRALEGTGEEPSPDRQALKGLSKLRYPG